MADNTKIEWAEASWSPITGCSKISPGCKNCYAERISKRLRGRFGYPKGDPFRVTFHPDKLVQPLHWKKPRRIFVCSMSDPFHENVEWNWQYKIFEIMFCNPDHTYLILTKRPERVMSILDNIWFHLGRNYGLIEGEVDIYPFPLKNLWLGVSCENQKYYDERWEIAKQIPCSKLFLSLEPLLGPIELRPWGRKPDLVIAGCESGPGRRPAKIEWFRDLRDQCQTANVPYFLKQMDVRGELIKMPLLDGVRYDQLPE